MAINHDQIMARTGKLANPKVTGTEIDSPN